MTFGFLIFILLKVLFSVFDYDADGYITASDLSVFIQQMTNHKVRIRLQMDGIFNILDQLSIGDRVRVKTDQRVGVLKYLGETKFASGVWAGLDLDGKGGDTPVLLNTINTIFTSWKT